MDITKELVSLGGTAVVAVYAIWAFLRISTNHIDHNTEAIDRNTEVLAKLSDTIGDLKEFLQRK